MISDNSTVNAYEKQFLASACDIIKYILRYIYITIKLICFTTLLGIPYKKALNKSKYFLNIIEHIVKKI